MSIAVALGGLAVVILLWGLLTYNRLTALRVKADESLGDIDTQLKRRWDLIPSLVTAVQEYSRHESDVFEQIAAARGRSASASSLREQVQAEEGLKEAMKSLFAIVEAYPELKADENFMLLQQTLEQIEDAIQRSRHYYNAVVRDFNMSIEVFPRNFIASLFGFHERDFYSLTGGAERTTPSARIR
ncbi:LemA family protein [Candidatus Bipolaricaulota bacterium]|nr:LemA family protein [Candidatus Bipolaricaulota bacterium]